VLVKIEGTIQRRRQHQKKTQNKDKNNTEISKDEQNGSDKNTVGDPDHGRCSQAVRKSISLLNTRCVYFINSFIFNNLKWHCL
jgi:hypothetical protein